ncbi:MAG: hypothetical protein ACE5HE_09465, partial [Phycisphaerae bacterium]
GKARRPPSAFPRYGLRRIGRNTHGVLRMTVNHVISLRQTRASTEPVLLPGSLSVPGEDHPG